MNARKNTLIAFFLNLSFSVIELIFGMLFRSSAVLADALHDFGDALAIGLSALLEHQSNKPANPQFTLGYKRLSLLGALITSAILISGSAFILIENTSKLFDPQPVNQDGMLVLGLIAIAINFLAARVVKKGQTVNESILSLHFLEDILGWMAVILVSIILQFTDWYFLDPLLSLLIAGFILSKALPKAYASLLIFLEASPKEVNLDLLQAEILSLEDVEAIHQLQVWTLDGLSHQATLHLQLVANSQASLAKEAIRQIFAQQGSFALTIEVEQSEEEHRHHFQKNVKNSDHLH